MSGKDLDVYFVVIKAPHCTREKIIKEPNNLFDRTHREGPEAVVAV